MRSFVQIAAASLLVAASAASARAEAPKAVLELFTSQGCSSCPEADRLAAELAKEHGVVLLTFPVDYWDYLGWKDTFGNPAHSARQRAYALVRGDRKVFTPQMVVNGLASATGSDRAAIEAAIRETAPRRWPVRRAGNGQGSRRPDRGRARRRRDRTGRGLAGGGGRTSHRRDRPRRECQPHRQLHQCGASHDAARRLERQARAFHGGARRGHAVRTPIILSCWCRRAPAACRAAYSAFTPRVERSKILAKKEGPADRPFRHASVSRALR